ncbi:transposase [Desulfovibrio sp. UIB00]|uniref:transposase n=1 Tax=Desulfovibrio sp. UIB00 TaxID=2804314 RepID=UPI001F0EE133|nr:transposase [Desulfovibrio sp. UIB00]MCH5146146.1 transposase [Desulfovibrio sp. UIB00]
MADVKKTTYSPAFKKEAVMLFLKGGRSYRQLCEELGIKNKKTLREWVAKINSGESLEDDPGKSSHAEHRGRPKTNFSSVEELAYVKAERGCLKRLYRSRFGHEWGVHPKKFFSK